MKKKVITVCLIVILAATGLSGCSEEKEPVEAAKKIAEKQGNPEPAKDFEDEREAEGETSTETESTLESEEMKAEEVVVPEIRVQPKPEEVSSQEVTEKEKPQQKKKKEPEKETTEKPKQEEQKAETPRHTHMWEPVYAERQVEKVKMIPWTKCYCCGADMTGNVYHIDEHLLNGDSNVHYGTEYREEIYYETEEYVSGYRCSCGKTKTN